MGPDPPTEACQVPAVPGYVDDALHRGATLNIDFDHGRFVFDYRSIDF